MPDQSKGKTEKTPQGMTVPVPKRNDFLGNLKRVAEPDKGSASGSPKK